MKQEMEGEKIPKVCVNLYLYCFMKKRLDDKMQLAEDGLVNDLNQKGRTPSQPVRPIPQPNQQAKVSPGRRSDKNIQQKATHWIEKFSSAITAAVKANKSNTKSKINHNESYDD